MTAITIGSSRSYIRNVHAAVHDLIVALLALDRKLSAPRNKRRRSGGASLHQAYADVLAAQAVSGEAVQQRRSARDQSARGASHALLPYYLWSARSLQD